MNKETLLAHLEAIEEIKKELKAVDNNLVLLDTMKRLRNLYAVLPIEELKEVIKKVA